MAFAGNGIFNSGPIDENYGAFLARKPNEGKIPNPSEMITGSSHIVVIDSRERNKRFYPNPACYSIKFNERFKNVTSLELKGSLLPKTEYNVNTGNMFIPYNILDYVTAIKVKTPGYGYVDGVYGTGGDPGTTNMVTITEPGVAGGVNALIRVTVSGSQITLVEIMNAGTGYLRGFYGGNGSIAQGFYKNGGASFNDAIPHDQQLKSRFKQADLVIDIGEDFVAQLTPGQYDFANPNDSLPGLCREVTRSFQASIDSSITEGVLIPVIGGPQTGAQYFPYSVLNADDGSCYLTTTNSNASPNVQLCIQRGSDDGTYTQSPFIELLWSNEYWADTSSVTLLGYGSSVLSKRNNSTTETTPMDQTNNSRSDQPWSIRPIIARNNYDIIDGPTYSILSFGEYTSDGDRIESTNAILDKAFATIVFDANTPDVIFRSPENVTPLPGTGPSAWNTLLSKPGYLKAIKGPDFDTKILSFGPAPLAELSGITICFRKFNGDLIDFHGKDHLLIFSINAQDINSGNKY
jgi:hypothetical protein